MSSRVGRTAAGACPAAGQGTTRCERRRAMGLGRGVRGSRSCHGRRTGSAPGPGFRRTTRHRHAGPCALEQHHGPGLDGGGQPGCHRAPPTSWNTYGTTHSTRRRSRRGTGATSRAATLSRRPGLLCRQAWIRKGRPRHACGAPRRHPHRREPGPPAHRPSCPEWRAHRHPCACRRGACRARVRVVLAAVGTRVVRVPLPLSL